MDQLNGNQTGRQFMNNYAQAYVSKAEALGLTCDGSDLTVDLAKVITIPSGLSLWMVMTILRSLGLTLNEPRFLSGEDAAFIPRTFYVWLDQTYQNEETRVNGNATMTVYLAREITDPQKDPVLDGEGKVPETVDEMRLSDDLKGDISKLDLFVSQLQLHLDKAKDHITH